jgi:uncharacterized membrane protein
MLPLLVFVLTALAARISGWILGGGWLDRWATSVAIGLAVMFALMSIAHFVQPRRGQLIDMVPPRLGYAGVVVTVTGVFEIAGAIGLLIPSTSRLAALCLALLLVTMYPANVYAARAGAGIRTMPLPARTLVQAVFICACLFVAFA